MITNILLVVLSIMVIILAWVCLGLWWEIKDMKRDIRNLNHSAESNLAAYRVTYCATTGHISLQDIISMLLKRLKINIIHRPSAYEIIEAKKEELNDNQNTSEA